MDVNWIHLTQDKVSSRFLWTREWIFEFRKRRAIS